MWKDRWSGALAIALVAGASAACGGPSELSSDEAAELTAELAGAGITGASSGLAGSPAQSGQLEATPIPFSRTVSHTQSCSGGGSISVSGSLSGSIDSETHDGSLSLNVTQSFTDCRITRGGKDFTVSGSPNLQLSGTITIVNGLPSGPQTLSFTGAFRWSAADGRSGSCDIDLTISWSLASPSTVTGTACGHQISRQV
ncbi:MAG: hypothetical protein HYV20_04310 [Gemmatimonadetes bacterium]|nr:hypothetical protein [Gemmatimonadota bacterium]